MQKNKKMLIVTSLLNLLPIVVGVILWDRLPMQVPSHWGADGNVDGYMGRGFLVFGMPVVMMAIQWLAILITEKDNKNRNWKAKRAVLWIIPLITWCTTGMSYSAALGIEPQLTMVLPLIMGILLIVLGNYMPKCAQNRTIGIKIKWTLENEENWNATHRFAGKVWFVGGLVILCGIFLPEEYMHWLVLGIFLPVILIPVLYSYCYYLRQKKQGTDVESKATVPSKQEKVVRAVALPLLAILLIGCALLMVVGDVQLEYGETAFTVDATFWSPLTVEYAAIDRLELTQEDSGSRNYGYGTPRLELGRFQNESFGTYTRYSYTQSEVDILVEADGQILVISGANAAETEAIFQTIQAGMERCQ